MSELEFGPSPYADGEIADASFAKAEAERSLLGAILLNNSAYHEIAAIVRVEEFILDSHRKIFFRISQLMDASGVVDMITLCDALDRNHELAIVGDVGYISGLVDGVPDRPSVKNYIALVKDAAKRRQLYAIATACRQRLVDASETTVDCLLSIMDSLWRLQANSETAVAVSMRSLLPRVMNEMCAERNRTGELIGLPTGLYDLDHCTGGIRLGEFWVVGALPGRGKTSLGLQFAVEAATHGHSSLEFSLEMSSNAIGRRFLAAMTDAGASMIRDPRSMSEDRWSEMQEAASHHIDHPLYVDDSASLSVQQLVALAKLYIQRHGIRLIVVDFLQLLKAPGKERREVISAAAEGLRELAKQEHVAVVALSQLSRPRDINERPTMLSIKESGDVEAAAHAVLLLYQPTDSEGALTGQDEIIIGKQREGPTGTIPVLFDKRKLIFRPRTDEMQ